MLNEMIEFPGGVMGLAMNLEEHEVGAVILGDDSRLKEGDTVKCAGRLRPGPVGRSLLGRVVNTLGEPIDGKGPIEAEAYYPVEKIASGIISRQSVSVPVQTGILPIDPAAMLYLAPYAGCAMGGILYGQGGRRPYRL